MHVYVHVYMHIYIYICIYIYLQAYVYVYNRMRMSMCIYMYMSVCNGVLVCLYVSSVAWRSVVDAVCDHMRVCTCARKQRVH